MLLSALMIFEILKMVLSNAGDLITADCRLLYFVTLLVTFPENEKFSEKERLMFCPIAELKIRLISASLQLIMFGKLLNCFGREVLLFCENALEELNNKNNSTAVKGRFIA